MRYRTSLAASATLATCAALVGRMSAAHETQPPLPLGDVDDSAMPLGKQGRSPDLALGDIAAGSPTAWGSVGGISAYSLNLTWCNVGDATVSWIQTTNQHAVGHCSIHRASAVGGATRFEQLGMSWSKHTFCALQQSLCGACTSCGGGCPSCLGVGCSNPYTSAGVGTQGQLGPRYQVNASTGFFNYPFDGSTPAAQTIGRRIQVASADLDPALNPGASYFAEGATVHPQDAAAGRAANNASHRKLIVGGLTGSTWQLSSSGPTTRFLPAIHAWKTFDPAVTLVNLDVPGDGRYVVGYRATDVGGGFWHYEYAVYNISSHRSGQSFSVPVDGSVKIAGIEFHGPLYHSGDKPDNVPWTASVEDGRITWSTPEFSGPAPAGNELSAYALRFGTLYNFRFDADAPPRLTGATLGLFRPGTPAGMTVGVLAPVTAPACAADLDESGAVDGLDLAALLAAWGRCPPEGPCPPDFNFDGIISGLDLAMLLAAWGPCS